MWAVTLLEIVAPLPELISDLVGMLHRDQIRGLPEIERVDVVAKDVFDLS